MDSDKPGGHDRTVVRALRSLGPPTAPTTAERARLRARLMAALDAETASAGRPMAVAPPATDGQAATRAVEPVGDATTETTAGLGPETTPSATTAHDTAPEAEATADIPHQAGYETGQETERETRYETKAGTKDKAQPRTEDETHLGTSGRTETEGETQLQTEGKTEAGAESASGRPRPVRRDGARSGAKRSAATGSGSSRAGRKPAPSAGHSARSRPGKRDDSRRSVMAGVRGRFAVAAVAVLALVGSLAGMSLLLARDALPGDALYGVKRTAEAASLGLTFGDEPKALKHLEFAAARISEIETLARRYPNPGDAPVGGYLTALTDFDNDAAAGSRKLIALATSTDGRLLESLRDWATQQTSRLHRLTARLPEAARNRQITSLALLDKITTRSIALLQRMDCYQITSGSYDDIGATPATGACEQDPGVSPGFNGSTAPSLPPAPDNSTPPDESTRANVPLAPVEPTPDVPPVPVPGITASVPAPVTRPGGQTPQPPPTQEQPPLLDLPPLLPGLGIG